MSHNHNHNHNHSDHGHDTHSHHDHGSHEGHEAHETDHAHAGHDAHAGHAGHGDHSGHDPKIFRSKFWISLALTVPTLVFSEGLQDILGLTGPRFPGSQFIPAAFGIVIFFYGGLVFLRGAVAELRSRQPGMMTLISLAILVAFGYSLAVTLGLPGMDFWWELATLITIMLLGHWIEMSAVMSAQDALGELAKLLPDEADVVHGDHVMPMPVASLTVGDVVLVRPGATVPIDGEVIEGESEINESLITGESAPVSKAVGDIVIGGAVNGPGSLTVRVTKVGSETALAGIMKLVSDAQASKSGAQVLADRAAALLFYVALGAAIITLVAWLFLAPDDPAFVLERVVSVLVIACPHALGLAIPLVSQISTALGARRGILVKNKLALEAARSIDVVLFDKTGTLTTGTLGVAAIAATSGSDDEVLALAAAVESKSEHPIARAIVAEAHDRGLAVAESTQFTALAGRGAQAVVDGRDLVVASHRVVVERAITLPVELVQAARDATTAGNTIVYLLEGEAVLGMFALADTVRPESLEAVRDLKERGVRVAMLTGDSHEVAITVAAQLGIDEVFAHVLPGEKADVVAKLQESGSVAMVGDGINDAPALARADVGIAIGAGTDVAIDSAGIVLASSDPRAVGALLKLSKATWRKELQNLFWATGYNAIGIPLAAGVLFGAGILLPPALAAVFMSVSTIIVAINAQLLRFTRL
ncbi:Cu2+-exporting ATPase [Microbacteriaceae bacterium SG_E_30_P1]|uniref:Cu2+-exporting ATPase n=1 Tax=Antiquaquibacter oligotrophicus TaxID=2880260 RepID=A0ABT6KNY8_9MICO|nr:copper-translocating P-type ATPase [Antiquaquibacter oligotrophicus]MDH6181496.1 Cu2+-exporting ATPase [Antiquaquibacter oligotrophicus]UDF12814.1 copper-translocating P-type ATPase [Antiquaquibacter oligotrophicus]